MLLTEGCPGLHSLPVVEPLANLGGAESGPVCQVSPLLSCRAVGLRI